MTDAVTAYRIAIGRYVRERLLAAPGVMKVPTDRLDLFVARSFLAPDECDGLIALIDAERIPSQLLAPTADPQFRTSESCNLDPAHPLVGRIEARIDELLGIPADQGEAVQGQRYAVGQQFKPHHDFFYETEAYWPAMEASGGQRTWTAMIFLNAPEAGGKTDFVDAGIAIAPRPGNLLAWSNLDADGAPNPFTLHCGRPVEEGVKYVVTKWYRERPWTASEVATY